MSDAGEYRAYIEDILDAISKAESFGVGLSYDEFREDAKTQFSVAWALAIIGEATKHVPPEIRNQAPDVPWRSMAGMRDKLIHAYTGVDFEVVWRTLKEELPALRGNLETLLASLEEEDEDAEEDAG